MNIQFFFLVKFRHIYLTFLFSYKHDRILHCMCIGIRLNSTFFKRALCRISSLPFVERLPYTFLMSLDISIPLSDLFLFQRRSLCSPKKVFCAHYVLSMSLFSMVIPKWKSRKWCPWKWHYGKRKWQRVLDQTLFGVHLNFNVMGIRIITFLTS